MIANQLSKVKTLNNQTVTNSSSFWKIHLVQSLWNEVEIRQKTC